jgi:hypothetical protein
LTLDIPAGPTVYIWRFLRYLELIRSTCVTAFREVKTVVSPENVFPPEDLVYSVVFHMVKTDPSVYSQRYPELTLHWIVVCRELSAVSYTQRHPLDQPLWCSRGISLFGFESFVAFPSMCRACLSQSVEVTVRHTGILFVTR